MFKDLFPVVPAAIEPDAPVRNVPVTRSNPFDLSRLTFADLQALFLWNKLMFDPRLLPTNPFFSSDSNLNPGADLLRQAPINPSGNAPILPPQFR